MMAFNNFKHKTIHPDRDSKMFFHYEISLKSLCESLVKRVEDKKDNAVMITGITGCLSRDTVVGGQTETLHNLYSSGKRLIKTVSLKQCVKAVGGAYYPVKSTSEIIDSGVKEVYEIELEDGRKVFATEEHKLFKVNGNKVSEEIVGNLKAGDELRCFKYKDYWEGDNKKHKMARKRKPWNPKSRCIGCGMLFFQKEKTGKSGYYYCKSCRGYKGKKREDTWAEWEDNLIRQFYYSYEKEELLELLSLRKWNAISHRAHRLGIERDRKFQTEKNKFSSTNNPMYSEKCRRKAGASIRNGYANGTIKIGGIALKSMMGLTKKENHPNWLGGISFEPYDSRWDDNFKKVIRNRDNYNCAMCNGYGNTVHHIDYNKLNSTADNCITLCNSCHVKTNYNREKWKNKFGYIMAIKQGRCLCNPQK